MNVRILLADDHKIMREGLQALIEQQPGLRVVGEAENGATTVHLAKRLRPDVVIMDIAMPDVNGIEATRQLVSELTSTKVIALSIHADRRFVTEMFRAGASGYLLKQHAFDELLIAIKKVAADRRYVSPSLLDAGTPDDRNFFIGTEETYYAKLTKREVQVLQLMAEGSSNKEIASLLHISVKTVETHRQHIVSKLGIRSLAKLTKFAIREGLSPLHLERDE